MSLTVTTIVALFRSNHRYSKFWFDIWFESLFMVPYRVTHQVVLKVLLTSKQKFRFSIKSLY